MELFKVIILFFFTTIYAQDTINTDQLQFFWDAKVFCSFLNLTVQTVTIFDYGNHNSAYLNGNTGEVFILSLHENSGVYFTGDVSDKAWNAKSQSYDQYVKTVDITDLWATGIKEGVQFDAVTFPDDFKRKLSTILVSQSEDYSSECDAYSYGLQITEKTYTHAIKGFENVFKRTQAPVRGDIQWYQGLVYGLGTFISPFGGMEVFKKNHVKLDFATIFSAQCGSEVLIYLLTQSSTSFDLGKVLGKEFESLTWIATILSRFSGDIYYGYDGFHLMVTNLVTYAVGETSELQLRFALTEYFTNERAVEVDLASRWQSCIEELQRSLKVLKLDGKFQAFSEVLQNIKDNDWVVEGANLTAAIDVIFKAKFSEESVEEVISALHGGDNGGSH